MSCVPPNFTDLLLEFTDPANFLRAQSVPAAKQRINLLIAEKIESIS
jgi:hypothetical protein